MSNTVRTPRTNGNKATNVAPVQVKETAELELTTMSVSEFMDTYDYIHIHESVRENVSGYLYLTFIDSANEASNIYFSEKAAEKLASGQLLDADFFQNLQMVYVEYTDEREARWKICPKGSGSRKDKSFFNF